MKSYKSINVYDVSMERIDFVFRNFNKIYLSFSGGKDSGAMLNLVIKYMRENNIKKKLGIQILDNEANYEYSYEFMHKIIEKNLDILDVYWCCLPVTLPCTVSAYMTEWQCWGKRDEERWIRPIPDKPYVVRFDKLPIDWAWFKENMNYDEFWDSFGHWYSGGERTANLIGIRAVESLNRFRAIINDRKETYKNKAWTKKNSKYVYNVYPIYDWRTEDIWTLNGKFDFDYNELYDIFYKAGLSIYQMRVASPFMSESKSSLNLYRVIDPHIWARLCARVQGANFAATYGKQLNYHSFKLPPGHSWKSFTKFLLSTLPKEVAENFKMRFIQSFKYWGRVGRGLPDDVIQQLKDHGVHVVENGKTAHGSKTLTRAIIKSFPDQLDILTRNNSAVASWKRFAITILKNDHQCKYMGLAQTKDQVSRQRELMEKYKHI